MVTAFVLIQAQPDRVHALAEELAALDAISEVYSVAGDVDLVAVVRVRDHEELAEVVTTTIGVSAGITHTRTLIAFRAYSRADLDAMWSIGLD